MLPNRKACSLPGPLKRDAQNALTWQKMLEDRSSWVICCHTARRCARGHQQRACPGGSRRGSRRGARCSTGGSSELGGPVSRTWPVRATERHDCISFQPATAPWAWCSSSCSASNPSSERSGQASVVTYDHQVNFLKRERASNSGTNGNTEYF